jgi:hypothetical protein
MPAEFDRLLGLLTGLTDTLHTASTTIRVIPTLGVGGSSTWIVQTYRQQERDEDGKVVSSADTVFLERLVGRDYAAPIRIPIPPPVVAAIARQRDALTSRTRARAAQAAALTRKAAPGYRSPRVPRRKGK